MAYSSVSGPWTSKNGFVNQTSTAAELGDAANMINVQWKTAGKQVVDLSTGMIYTATGSKPTDSWVSSDGLAENAVTPA